MLIAFETTSQVFFVFVSKKRTIPEIFAKNIRWVSKMPSNQHISGYTRIFFSWTSENISGNSPIFSAVKIPCWSTAEIFRGNLRYFLTFSGAAKHFGDSPDIAVLHATFGRRKRSKNIGDDCKKLYFRGKPRNFCYFPWKKKYQGQKNTHNSRGCFKSSPYLES